MFLPEEFLEGGEKCWRFKLGWEKVGGSLYTEHSFGRLKDYNGIVFDPFILGSDESIDSGGRGQEKGVGGGEYYIMV